MAADYWHFYVIKFTVSYKTIYNDVTFCLAILEPKHMAFMFCVSTSVTVLYTQNNLIADRAPRMMIL